MNDQAIPELEGDRLTDEDVKILNSVVVDFGDVDVEVEDEVFDENEYPEEEEREVSSQNFFDLLPDYHSNELSLDVGVNAAILGVTSFGELEILPPQEGYEDGEGL